MADGDEDQAPPPEYRTASYLRSQLLQGYLGEFGEIKRLLSRGDVLACDQFMVRARSWRKRSEIVTPQEFRMAGGISPHGQRKLRGTWNLESTPHLRTIPEQFSDTQDLLSANLLSEIKSWGSNDTATFIEALQNPRGPDLFSVSWIMTEKRTEYEVRHAARVRTDEEIRTEFGVETLDQVLEHCLLKGWLDDKSPIHQANFARRVCLAQAEFSITRQLWQETNETLMYKLLVRELQQLALLGIKAPYELPKQKMRFGSLWLPGRLRAPTKKASKRALTEFFAYRDQPYTLTERQQFVNEIMGEPWRPTEPSPRDRVNVMRHEIDHAAFQQALAADEVINYRVRNPDRLRGGRRDYVILDDEMEPFYRELGVPDQLLPTTAPPVFTAAALAGIGGLGRRIEVEMPELGVRAFADLPVVDRRRTGMFHPPT